MPYSWELKRRADSFSGERNISSIALVSGLWRVTLTAADSNVALGKLHEIRLSTTTANNGVWTIVRVTSTSIFSVAETLTAQGASGRSIASENGTLKVGATAITSFVDTQTIRATGALFQTNNVVLGDRVGIYNGALNLGSFFVTEVLDENNIKVAAAHTLAANPLTVGGVTGETLVVYDGYGTLTMTDIASASWAAIQTQYPTLVRSQTIAGITRYRFGAIRRWEWVQTGATSTTFISEQEIVEQARTDTMAVRIEASGATATQSVLRLGRAGSDAIGFSRGSYWFGLYSVFAGALLRTEMYGSAIYGANGTSWALGPLGKIVGSLISEVSFNEATAAPGFEAAIRQFMLSNVTGIPPNILTGSVEINDLFVGDTGATSFIAFANVVISDFRISDDVVSPPWQLFGSTATFRDPKVDYLLSQLISYFDANSTGKVDYSWIPRFVFVDPSGLTPTPISGLTVHVYEFLEGLGFETEVSGSPWVTDAQGQINSGNPIYLIARQDIVVPPRTTFEYACRITVEGPNYQFINRIFKMRSPFDGDIAVDLLSIDFEGELPI